MRRICLCFWAPLKHNLHRPRRAPSHWGHFFFGAILPASTTLQWPMPPDPYVREKFTRIPADKEAV